ncbi:50S ribosomal protein L24 [Candidatus Gracilibacteria bacterium]|jgi:large subunit ribosomal protein L24|nr:50S ribosomal protein L24 [Candidatus Gracilibacteria bacterium]
MKIKKNDLVIIITGKDRNKTGKVLQVIPTENKVLVEGVNFATKHVKAREGVPGGIIKSERPIDGSNVMLLDPSSNKPTRVGYRVEEGKKKVRYAKLSGEALS